MACAAAARRSPGILLRALAVAAAAGAAAGPVWIVREVSREPGILSIVLDETSSMDRPGRREQASKAAAAAETQAKKLGVEARIVRVPDSVGADGRRTDLWSSAVESAAAVPPGRRAGVLLITDGLVHDAPTDPSEAARRLGAPAHVWLAGRKSEIDRSVRWVGAPAWGVAGGKAKMAVRLECRGPTDCSKVQARVFSGSKPAGTVDLREGEDVSFEVPVEATGTNVVRVAIDHAQGDLSKENDSAWTVVTGVRDRLRVLLISGRPDLGERVWRGILKSDPSVDLLHFTILRTGTNVDPTPQDELALIPFPVDELFSSESLDRFDLVVFDRWRNGPLLTPAHHKAVVDRTARGGALLLAQGEEIAGPLSPLASPLGEAAPVEAPAEWSAADERPRPTRRGAAHPWLGGLAEGAKDWGTWPGAASGARAKPGAAVLLETGKGPLLVAGAFGAGRSAALLSDGGWAWERGRGGSGPYAELLRRTIHWLLRESALEEESLEARRSGAGGGGRIELTWRGWGAPPAAAAAVGPDGRVVEVPLRPAAASGGADGPAGAEGELEADDGVWTFQAGGARAWAPAGNAGLESKDAAADPGRLKPVVDASGGSLRRLEDGTPELRLVERRTDGSHDPVSGAGWDGILDAGPGEASAAVRDRTLPTGLLCALAAAFAGAAWATDFKKRGRRPRADGRGRRAGAR